MTRPPATLSDFLSVLKRNRRTIWLGQSVDTSVIHTGYTDYVGLPILTSVGCVLRRPVANAAKFDTGLRSRIGATGQLMVDSGGFVLMSGKGCRWAAKDVAKLYRRIDADHLVSLDVPPNGRDDKGDRFKKYRQTIRNLGVLLDEFGSKVVPVVHGRGQDEIERNCKKVSRLTPAPSLVAIGGLVPTLQRCGSVRKPSPETPQSIVTTAIRCVRSYFPRARIHVFGVGSVHTVLGVMAAGAHSVDSIGWRQAAGFGSVYVPGRHRRLLTERERETPCRPYASDSDLKILRHCLCPACQGASKGNIAALANHFKPRAAHNIWVLYGEVAGYLYAKKVRRGDDYLSARLSEAWLEALQ